jgi:preprotein translocase subunit Sss1
LIGEKLVNFVRAGDSRAEFARELPEFLAEIKRIFEPWEIREYLENIRRVGPFAHTCTDEEYAVLRAAGALDEDPVRGAEDVLIVGRITEMLLE